MLDHLTLGLVSAKFVFFKIIIALLKAKISTIDPKHRVEVAEQPCSFVNLSWICQGHLYIVLQPLSISYSQEKVNVGKGMSTNEYSSNNI